MSARRLWILLAITLATALAALIWLRLGGSPENASSPVAAPASAALPASAPSLVVDGGPADHWGLMARLSAQADQVELEARREKALLLDPSNDAAWCERGPSRLAHSMHIMREAGGTGSPRGPAAEALTETAEELLQRWAAQLTARGDAASLATRDFLLANLDAARLLLGKPGSSDHRAASAAHLLQSGLNSSDGYVLRLAAQQACRKTESTQCLPILRRWSQLEPANLDVQLWRLSLLPESVDDSQWVPFLTQAAKSDQGENHRERYLQIVAQLMSLDGPAGLRTAAALQLATAALYLQEDSRMFFLIDRCRAASSTEAKAACVATADRLYSQPFRPVLARMVAAALAREQAPGSQLWQQREEEVLALRYWSREHRDPSDAQVEALKAGSCAAQPELAQLLRRTAHQDELADMRETLGAQGLDVKSYLAQVRGKR